MAYIELQPGEELTVAFAEGTWAYEVPQVVIKYRDNGKQVHVSLQDDDPAPSEPVLQMFDINGRQVKRG